MAIQSSGIQLIVIINHTRLSTIRAVILLVQVWLVIAQAIVSAIWPYKYTSKSTVATLLCTRIKVCDNSREFVPKSSANYRVRVQLQL